MANLSAASRRNSSGSASSVSPKASVSGNTRMSSLNEEDISDHRNNFTEAFLLTHNETDNNPRSIETKRQIVDAVTKEDKIARSRLCSERSDSGFSDCSIHNSSPCSCTPLLSKKSRIKEESEDQNLELEDEPCASVTPPMKTMKSNLPISRIAQKFENLSNSKNDKSVDMTKSSPSKNVRASRMIDKVTKAGELPRLEVDSEGSTTHFSKLEVKLSQSSTACKKGQTAEGAVSVIKGRVAFFSLFCPFFIVFISLFFWNLILVEMFAYICEV